MGVNFENTSDANGFNIFEKLTTDEFSVGGQKNKLNLYILKIHDKLFSYDKLYDYVLDNICQYVFNRRKNLEVQNDIKKAKRLILEAIDHLREVNSDKDSGAGGELGEILLYLFLEQDLKAPKLFSKIELKTSTNEYIKSRLAENYSAYNNMIYFTDALGLEDKRNKYGSLNSYKTIVPHNFEEEYINSIEKNKGFNPMDALAKNFKAKGLDKTEKELYKKIVKYRDILENKPSLKTPYKTISIILGSFGILAYGMYAYLTKQKSSKNIEP